MRMAGDVASLFEPPTAGAASAHACGTVNQTTCALFAFIFLAFRLEMFSVFSNILSFWDRWDCQSVLLWSHSWLHRGERVSLLWTTYWLFSNIWISSQRELSSQTVWCWTTMQKKFLMLDDLAPDSRITVCFVVINLRASSFHADTFEDSKISRQNWEI